MVIFPFYAAEFVIDAWISADQLESSETNEQEDKENEREDWRVLPNDIWKDIFLRSSIESMSALRRATPSHFAISKWRAVESNYWEKKCRAGDELMPPDWIFRISRRFPQQYPLNWKDIFECKLFRCLSPTNLTQRKGYRIDETERLAEKQPLIITVRSTNAFKKITDSNSVSISFLERLDYPDWILDIVQPSIEVEPVEIREYDAVSDTLQPVTDFIPISASLHGELSVEGDWWINEPESKDYNILMAAKKLIVGKNEVFSDYGSGLRWIRFKWQREPFDEKDERFHYGVMFPLECPPHLLHLLSDI